LDSLAQHLLLIGDNYEIRNYWNRNHLFWDIERIMKSHYDSIRTIVLTLAMTIFLTVSLMGCNDPIVTDMEAEHHQLGKVVEQELQQSRSAYPPSSQTEAIYPAP